MSRPRLFDETRRQINMYLHNEQYVFVIARAKELGISPSALMRMYIDADRGVDSEKIGPQGTNAITKENI